MRKNNAVELSIKTTDEVVSMKVGREGRKVFINFRTDQGSSGQISLPKPLAMALYAEMTEVLSG